MKNLTLAFLKIFFRNRRAMFFIIFLPVGIYLAAAFLGLEGIVRFEKAITYKDFLLTGVIAFALMQTGIYSVSYTFIDYYKSQVMKRLSVTPLSAGRLLGAQVAARFVVALIQAAVLLGIGTLLFGARFSPLILLLPAVVFVGNTLYLNVGFILSSVTRDYEQAAPYTTVIGMVSMFLGDVFFPVENLPDRLAQIADFLPLKPLVTLLRYTILGIQPANLIQDTAVFLLWFVFLSAAARLIFSKKAYR